MKIHVDSYTSTSKREIDTLEVDAPFMIERKSKSAYDIVVGDHTFEVAIADGKNCALDFNSPHGSVSADTSIDKRDPKWPQSIVKLTGKTGFHLEMMTDSFYSLLTPDQGFNFRIASGPRHAYITVKEISEGVEHIPGPNHPREIVRGKEGHR